MSSEKRHPYGESRSVAIMRRATPAQQFGAVISERAPETRDLAASQELEKFLRVMGLYENDKGSRRRKVGRVVYLPLPVACVLWLACDFPGGLEAEVVWRDGGFVA